MPRVSVVIPTYNRAGLVVEAVQSVLAQTLPDLEVLVVNDGSTDGTAAALAPLATDPRLRVLVQTNQGRSSARNHGAREARADLLAFLDSDDRYPPDALAAHLRVFDEHPAIGLTVGGYEYINTADRMLSRRAPWLEGGALELSGWLFNCFSMPGAVIVRRGWFDQVGGFNTRLMMAEDWDLFLQLAAHGCPMAWVRTSTCLYRLHTGNSIRRLNDHLKDSLGALDHVFARPDLSPAVRALEAPARAWLYVIFARKAHVAADPSQAHAWLAEAIRLDPALAAARRSALLETWLTPPAEWTDTPEDYSHTAATALPPELRPNSAELRRALGRLAMARFFQANAQGCRPEAGQALRAGLRHDPTWLANRGVLAFLARGLLPARKPG